MDAKAIIFPEKGKIELGTVRLPELQEDQILVETLYSFVSPGSELRVLEGYYGAADKFPLVPGYAEVARVAETGSKVTAYKKGDLLCCRGGNRFDGASSSWGGQVSGMVLASDYNPVILPEEAKKNPLAYAPVEVAAISYRGFLSTDAKEGESAVVIGQGMIGCFVAAFLRLAGCRVAVCDLYAQRLSIMEKSGCFSVDLSREGGEERLQAFVRNNGYDIVSECSGSSEGFLLANRLLRKPVWARNMRETRANLPRLLLQANYTEKVPVDPSRFFSGEGAILLSPADRTFEDRAAVVELIHRGKLDTSSFTENIFTFEEMPQAYMDLKNHRISSVVCKWRDF